MPRQPNPVPTYRLHAASGQAVCTVRLADGSRKDLYLGVHDSAAAKPFGEPKTALAHWQSHVWRESARIPRPPIAPPNTIKMLIPMSMVLELFIKSDSFKQFSPGEHDQADGRCRAISWAMALMAA